MDAVPESRELRQARARLARAVRSHGSDDENPEVADARSAYQLERARSLMGQVLALADDMNATDTRTLAREMRQVARDL